MRSILAILLLLGATSCGKRAGVPVEDAPAWMNENERVQVRLDLAETLLAQHRPDPALSILAQLRAESVDDPVVDLFQGQALYQQGLYTEARSLLEVADASMGKDPRPDRALGLLYADTDQPELAIEHFRKAVSLDEDAATWNNLGFMLQAQRRYDEAIPALQRAVALDGTQARYRNNLGFALAATGRHQEALDTFMSMGNPADAHANLGTALELAGDDEGAATQYALALEHNPSHPSAQEAMERVRPALPEVP